MTDFISFREITKRFPGTIALNRVSFGVREGEIHALLGENGAGKTTLLNILHGIFPATSGEFEIAGSPIKFGHAKEALDFGIAKVHQEINLIPEMTVYQNLLLGDEPTRFGFIRTRETLQEIEELIASFQSSLDPMEKVMNLSVAHKQMLQILKALRMKASIISFDEPTASLSKKESDILFENIRKLKAGGVTILYISHKLDEIFDLCDRATVLRDGHYIDTYEVRDLKRETLINSMVGRDVSMFAKRYKASQAERSQVVLDVRNFSGGRRFKDVTFQLKKGEILGFFGLVGAGRTEVMRAIFGIDPHTDGQVFKDGQRIRHFSPANSLRNGVGLIPENRKEEGFVYALNNAENIALASLRKYLRGGFLRNVLRRKNALLRGEEVGLNPNDPEFPTSNLSGGNSQKVVLAKWLSTDADILIFDEPTKGIDVGAKAEIYHLMESLVEAGKSIIMVSSELPEVIGMSDRIAVMSEGRITKVLDKDEFSEETILTCALRGENYEDIC